MLLPISNQEVAQKNLLLGKQSIPLILYAESKTAALNRRSRSCFWSLMNAENQNST